MAVKRTEQQHPMADGLDLQPPEAVLRFLAEAQIEAAGAVLGAIDSIAKASAIAAETLRSGGRLAYAAAGSSGLMALADALELPGTFGIPRNRIVVMLAGGLEALSNLAGAPEDDAEQAALDVADAGLSEGDCLIVLSASGSTPYAVAALEQARRRKLKTIAIANNPDTPIVNLADAGIVLATPPELIAGSTRMGAGTSQKIALNMLSTLMAIKLGHVHDGYMVNLHADNLKLRERAARIVAAISGCDQETAAAWLEKAGGSVKTAVLLAAGAGDRNTANGLLERTGQKLRPALSELEGSSRSQHGT
ncbi:N-acetylmuramic acid 6-phosphate etherase [Mesorhizobium albiziae]|uniref:N-acetylmuramic acid 6-phosphate etherase n=1 Tax=Neomesorhizobium albiziae TaxID=335020 RepID=A0A1I3Y7T6_9HYPH|nr:N-acetylmuramic acid 6-phosphate etherase [Mesorhizobium albiziae]GLS30067.1 N-acetylmuramic acid 6-phosphate etherase [Mesorhizobium albiziae]SFK27331.1 N-acetylmuramic acid 6-phosphate etherase [Mesorhizobium albiziae]